MASTDKEYRVIISGDRNWDDLDLRTKMRQLLVQMPPGVEIIHGGCRGVDMMADQLARELGFVVKQFPADWNKYGRTAGPIRNKEMLKYASEKISAVYLFHQHITDSKGTKNMMNQAQSAGVPFLLIN